MYVYLRKSVVFFVNLAFSNYTFYFLFSKRGKKKNELIKAFKPDEIITSGGEILILNIEQIK